MSGAAFVEQDTTDQDTSGWGDPPRRVSVPHGPELHLEGYDGPLDLLLGLAERQRIDLGRLSMAQLAEQFAAAMAVLAHHVPLERRADWVIVAARLLLLRSQLLFPATAAAAESAEQEAAEAEARLAELGAMQAARRWLERRPQLGLEVWTRPLPGRPVVSSSLELFEACLLVLRGPRRPPEDTPGLYRPVLFRAWPLDAAIARIRAMVEGAAGPVPLGHTLPDEVRRSMQAPLTALGPEHIDPDPNPDPITSSRRRQVRGQAALACHFLAGLELAKQQVVGMEQAGSFEAISLVGTEAERARSGRRS
jgi:segregation and condensation protein A